MFKSKQKIRELTERVKSKDREIEALEKRLKAFHAAEDGTPSDCKRGTWCKSCEFRKALHIPRKAIGGFVMSGYDTVYFCGKGESCKNFVQKEV